MARKKRKCHTKDVPSPKKRVRFADPLTTIHPVEARPPPPTEVVFSFDTTSNMYPYFVEARRSLAKMIKCLQEDIPDIRLAVLAHGDYDDYYWTYVTKYIDFSTDCDGIVKFAQGVEETSTGDFPACYELVLRQVRTELSWTPGSRRSLVLIGDAIPHTVDYAGNVDEIDWMKEAEKLSKDMNVRVYAVHCFNDAKAMGFFKTLAERTGGMYLNLMTYTEINYLFMAICYKEFSDEFLKQYVSGLQEDGEQLSENVQKFLRILVEAESRGVKDDSLSMDLEEDTKEKQSCPKPCAKAVWPKSCLKTISDGPRWSKKTVSGDDGVATTLSRCDIKAVLTNRPIPKSGDTNCAAKSSEFWVDEQGLQGTRRHVTVTSCLDAEKRVKRLSVRRFAKRTNSRRVGRKGLKLALV